jgi:hypothetical protein
VRSHDSVANVAQPEENVFRARRTPPGINAPCDIAVPNSSVVAQRPCRGWPELVDI